MAGAISTKSRELIISFSKNHAKIAVIMVKKHFFFQSIMEVVQIPFFDLGEKNGMRLFHNCRFEMVGLNY